MARVRQQVIVRSCTIGPDRLCGVSRFCLVIGEGACCMPDAELYVYVGMLLRWQSSLQRPWIPASLDSECFTFPRSCL